MVFYMLTLCKTAGGADSAIALSMLLLESQRINAMSTSAEPSIQQLGNVG